jgi:peroxin-6
MAELDGSSSREHLFVLGATNRPDMLDPALLRPGRLDVMVRIGPPETRHQQEAVLRALTRKFTLGPDIDMASVADRCPTTLSGADYYAICAEAMLGAMRERMPLLGDGRKRDGVDGEGMWGEEEEEGCEGEEEGEESWGEEEEVEVVEEEEGDGSEGVAGEEGEEESQQAPAPIIVCGRHFDTALASVLGPQAVRAAATGCSVAHANACTQAGANGISTGDLNGSANGEISADASRGEHSASGGAGSSHSGANGGGAGKGGCS